MRVRRIFGFSSAFAAVASSVTGYWYIRHGITDDEQTVYRLLRLCSSDNMQVKDHAIRRLVQIPLPDWKIRQVAQRCSPGLLVSLTRFTDVFVQSLWFESIDNSDDYVEIELEKVLLALRPSTTDRCVQYFTELALHKQKIPASAEEELLWTDVDQVADADAFSYRMDVKRLLLYLEALSLQATIPNQRDLMSDLGIQMVLKRLCDNLPSVDTADKSEHLMLSLALKIAANLAIVGKIEAEQMIRSGWLKTLLNLRNSTSKLDIKLLTTKVIYNLSCHFVPECSCLSDGLYLLNEPQSNQTPLVDFVFVHGLYGGVFKTWRQKDLQKGAKSTEIRTRCWPKDWLPNDLNFPFRAFAFDYSTLISDWGARCPDETLKARAQPGNIYINRSQELRRELVSAGLGKRPIIWVFFSAPHFGSPVATYILETVHRHLLLPSAEVCELVQESPFLRKLNERFLNLFDTQTWKCLNIAEGSKMKRSKWETFVVLPNSAYPGRGEFYTVDETHLTTCKPDSRDSLNYRIFLQFLRSVV